MAISISGRCRTPLLRNCHRIDLEAMANISQESFQETSNLMSDLIKVFQVQDDSDAILALQAKHNAVLRLCAERENKMNVMLDSEWVCNMYWQKQNEILSQIWHLSASWICFYSNWKYYDFVHCWGDLSRSSRKSE